MALAGINALPKASSLLLLCNLCLLCRASAPSSYFECFLRSWICKVVLLHIVLCRGSPQLGKSYQTKMLSSAFDLDFFAYLTVGGTSSNGTDGSADTLNVVSTSVPSISPDATSAAGDTDGWQTTPAVMPPASSGITGIAAEAAPTTMLSSATYVYTMGTGSSTTVVTITTVITNTFTETSVCSASFLRCNHRQVPGK